MHLWRKLTVWCERSSVQKMFWIILLVGFTARLAFAFLIPDQGLARFEMERVAISLAQTGVLGNPYAIPTGPSAHIAPLYASLMAAIFWAFGTGAGGEAVKMGMCALFSTLQYALFPQLARSLGLSVSLGFCSGLLAALLPLKPGSDVRGDWEAAAAAAFLVLCLIGVAGTWRSRKLGNIRATGQGVCWGLALLTAPAFLTLYMATLVVGLLLFLRTESKTYLRFAVIQTACVACLLAPWVMRNWVQLGSPIVTRSNTGLELRISNNEFAGPNELANYRAGVYHRYHPLQNVKEAEKVRDLGEVEYNRQAAAEAVAWIKSHPQRFLRLSLQRAALFWFSESDALRSVLFWGLSIASFAGAWLLFRQDIRAGLVLIIPLLVQPLPHYLVHVNVRHKYPVDWIGVIGLAIVVHAAYSRWFHTPSKADVSTLHGRGADAVCLTRREAV